MDVDLARRTVTATDTKKWKTTLQIANEVDEITSKVLPILLYGRNRIFVYSGPNNWRLRNKLPDSDLEEFYSEVAGGIQLSEKVVRRYENSNLNRKKPNNHKWSRLRVNDRRPGADVDYATRDQNRAEVVQPHGFGYGKRKLYKGPEGQYWTDPNFKKKEY